MTDSRKSRAATPAGPRFGTFWFASLLSNMGTWAQQIAEPWLLLSLGASSFVIGLDSFASAAPAWVLTLLGGMLADRRDRRRVIATFQSIQMLCPVTVVILLLTGTAQPWMIVMLSLVVGITDALSMPSFQTITRSIVDREQVGIALALNATQFNLSRILGPALAGVMMASLGAIACFSANAASFVPFILVAFWVLPKGPTPANSDGHESWNITTNLREVSQHPALVRALATVFLTSMLCGPLIVFSPLLIRDILHGDVTTFGGVVGAFGIGGVLGSLLLVAGGSRVDRQWLSTSFAVCYGAILILAALAPWTWALTLLFVLAGLAMNVSNTSVNTTLQTAAPAYALGRTVSVYMLALRGGLSIGSFATGLSVALLGVREALLMNGLLAVVAQLALAVSLARRTKS
jgi:predicted MFS family arabinose efflux permease